MQTICKTHFLQQVYRKIDGAVVDSQNERNLDCVTTFQTHTVLQRFMIHFDRLMLDCNDHLFIYDGAHAVGAHKVMAKLINFEFIYSPPPLDSAVVETKVTDLSAITGNELKNRKQKKKQKKTLFERRILASRASEYYSVQNKTSLHQKNRSL